MIDWPNSLIARLRQWPAFVQVAWSAELRDTATNYAKVFTGDFGRLLIQVAYFLVLANTLTLDAMGVFAAVLASGLILANFSGLGFGLLMFKLISARPRLAGSYLATTYTMLVATLPVAAIISLPIYFTIFDGRISPVAFAQVLFCELMLWRLVEAVIIANNASTRYAAAAAGQICGVTARALAAVGFWLSGLESIEAWAHFYFAFNLAGTILILFFFHPRVRLRFSAKATWGRMRDAAWLGFSNFLMSAQNEADKIVVLGLVDARAAGIYAISIRVIELIAVPVRTFYTLYTRRLVRQGTGIVNITQNLLVEVAVFAVSTGGFLILMGLLYIQPELLGANVAKASVLYGALLFVPAFRNLCEFHLVLYFAYGRMAARALMVALIGTLRITLFVVMVVALPDMMNWGLWLNVAFASLYLLSLSAVYNVLTDRFTLHRLNYSISSMARSRP